MTVPHSNAAKDQRPFKERLRELICVAVLDLEKAQALSMELHAAEKCGYQLSHIEDSLWSTLTRRIMDARTNATSGCTESEKS